MTEPWNSLPESVVQTKSINTFKNRLDQFWSNQAILYNYETLLNIRTAILKLLIDDDEDLINEEKNPAIRTIGILRYVSRVQMLFVAFC